LSNLHTKPFKLQCVLTEYPIMIIITTLSSSWWAGQVLSFQNTWLGYISNSPAALAFIAKPAVACIQQIAQLHAVQQDVQGDW